MGALDVLTREDVYEQVGDMTPADTAQVFRWILQNATTKAGECMSGGIGRIEYYCAPPVDEIAAGLLLPADDTTWYLKADYPEFWAWALASGKSARFHRDATHFAPAMLTSKFIKGEGPGSLGDGGGQDSVTLTVANLPPHTHTEVTTGITGLFVAPGEVPAIIAAGAGVTGSTGSGTSFDNRPNFSNELAYIRVR